jgi:transposase
MARRGRPTIDEDHQSLQQRLRQERDPERKRRLHMLVLFSSENPPTRQQVAEHLAVTRATIARWLSCYADGGIERLLRDQPRGPKPGQRLLPEEVLAAIEHRLHNGNNFSSYIELQSWLESEYGLQVNYKSLYGLVRYRLKARLKVVPRSSVRKP